MIPLRSPPPRRRGRSRHGHALAVSSRTIRTGDEVLVSTPISTASRVTKPGIFRSNSVNPDFMAAMTNGGRTSFSSACLTPGQRPACR